MAVDKENPSPPPESNTARNDEEVPAPKKSMQRWAILRNAIVKSTAKSKSNAGSIHRFEGFGFLNRQRLPRISVATLQDSFTKIDMSSCEDIVTAVELSLLALTALKPAQWVWELNIEFSHEEEATNYLAETTKVLELLQERLQQSSASDPKQRLRLADGSGWLDKEIKDTTSAVLKIVLAPFMPSQGIFQYTLPSFDKEGRRIENDDTASKRIRTRERRTTAASCSLKELTSHHWGVDNTGQICVWDSEQTMAYSLLKFLAMGSLPWWPTKTQQSIDILELGAGMAGLAGLSLVQHSSTIRLWLTDGHPQAVQNNQVHAHMMQCPNDVKCLVLPWSTDPPPNDNNPPPCRVALVSDCTHFQEFHAHLFFTLAYGVQVDGYVYLCQPHRGNSLQRFLELVQVTSTLFSMEWMDAIPELKEADAKARASDHYDPNLHLPHLIVLRKLRNVQETDRRDVLEHMKTRDSK